MKYFEGSVRTEAEGLLFFELLDHADEHHAERQRESTQFGGEMNELARYLALEIHVVRG